MRLSRIAAGFLIAIHLIAASSCTPAAPAASTPVPGAAAAGAAVGSEPEVLEARVLRVHDGDTLQVELPGGRREKVRIIGIDAPEQGRGGSPEIGAGHATRTLRSRVEGTPVRLVLDPVNRQGEHRDVYGRLLAYVETPEGDDVGRALLESGAVRLFRRFEFERKRDYAALEERARRQGVGLWSRGSGEWDRLLEGGAQPVAVYPTGGDLWAVCYSRRVRRDVPSGELVGVLKEIRRLQLAARGEALRQGLSDAGFVPTPRCAP